MQKKKRKKVRYFLQHCCLTVAPFCLGFGESVEAFQSISNYNFHF